MDNCRSIQLNALKGTLADPKTSSIVSPEWPFHRTTNKPDDGPTRLCLNSSKETDF